MPRLNLICDPWIPIVTRHGRRDFIRPADLTRHVVRDPCVEIAWPRADFRAAQIEFLIGLFTTACQPNDNSVWERWWKAPPTPEILANQLRPYEPAFDLDGDGPLFLQDRDDLGAEESPVAGLLIEQPGANTEKNNADLFVKRGKVRVLARSTAAIALYTLQTFAPSGGAGHRTGLRGGGPLTTLAKASGRPTLWDIIWLNVVAGLYVPNDDGEPLKVPDKAFPWLAPTRVSNEKKGGVATTPQDIHPVQCFWGMPRRIALGFEPNPQALPCDITGQVEPCIVRVYRTRPYGVNYQSVPHPLTPTYRLKPGTEPLPVHPQPSGIAYRHWLSLVQSSELRTPAQVLIAAQGPRLHGKGRLLMFGYDMDNMKARGFVEAEMPLFFASDAGQIPAPRQDNLERLARRMVEAAVEVAGLTLSQIKAAKGDGDSELDLIREIFFAATEGAFFQSLQKGLDAIEGAPAEGADASQLLLDLGKTWLATVLRPEALATFDRHIRPEAIVDSADLKAIQRMAKACAILNAALMGYGPAGQRLFGALGLAAPVKPARLKQAKAGASP